MNLLEMKNVKKSFGDLEVLRDISLEVEDGEGAKPMTELQLERTLNAIEFLDRERMEEPREWDKTPIG